MNTTADPETLSWRRIAALSSLILLAWTFFGLLASFLMFVNTDDERKMYPLSLVLHLSLGNNLLKGVVLLPFIWIFYKVSIPLTDWKRRTVLYFLLLPVFAAIHAAVRPFVVPFVLTGPPPPGTQITYPFNSLRRCAVSSSTTPGAFSARFSSFIFGITRGRSTSGR